MEAVPEVEFLGPEVESSVPETVEGFRQAQPADGFRQAQPTGSAQPAGERFTEYRTATLGERVRESRAFVPVVVVLLALLLILGAYAIGRALADGNATETESNGERRDATEPWDGEVTDVQPGKVQADCTSKPGVDAGGKKVRYDAANMTDGDPTTAWRCDGDASGRELVIALPPGTEVGEVGLIPGYAKTDPVDGADRYAENNRITRVRWTLAGGVQVEQELDGAADNREMQTMRVPRTQTDELRLEILEVTKGPRNTTAISEVRVAAAG
jgi:hypothetical protein